MQANHANAKYIQYSKLFTGIAGVVYIIQVTTTIVLVCAYSYASSALLDILGTTTGLVGLIFGCYTGNSTVEKYIRNKAAVPQAVKTGNASADAIG